MDAATTRPPSADLGSRIAAPLFHRILDRVDRGLVTGAIEAELPDGTRRLLGGNESGPFAAVRVVRWRALWRLVSAGSIGWYEGWEAGDWTSPDPVPVFDLFMRNRAALGDVARAKRGAKLAARLFHRLRRNDRGGARRNVAAHYDLGNDFYREWLDETLTYSSARYDAPGEPLAEAQRRKLAAILARTGATAGQRVLEIGCGWGSFAAAAAAAELGVHALTLSTEQRDHVAARALPGVSVALCDYRDVTGVYDGVASIEMVEAVGPDYWPAYCATLARVLRPGGRAALQLIAIADDVWDAYAGGVDFIQRYIFPGGSLVSVSRFRAIAAAHGLAWQDEERFGLDYAETLLEWRRRFDRAAAEGRLPARFDERFQRLWRYYLMYCEGGFRGGGIDVLQVTLVRE
ncbi:MULTISPECIES: cyclopropane-fatty-acyl-phospholipid synthase family protein [unclassified Sphingomonas]|uniref:SAM-dependent methyltransferase n=1 Tax=unclassified Sphingomonas TaxID=196159 RepID=UPI0016223D91|nr:MULTISPECIES: cyclopropane-fatty-acyl-phospholipid synthase family protein [unclassified Sphingomonas]MBB3346616.1 cyclopropane-fatty-acyl-phospholipid synthase [Sphingomonas sp. BK069]MBB3473068.1 cyclopropane-fatty-acyl-phospholipid synthase [Sphingomonas sp. BK345]